MASDSIDPAASTFSTASEMDFFFGYGEEVHNPLPLHPSQASLPHAGLLAISGDGVLRRDVVRSYFPVIASHGRAVAGGHVHLEIARRVYHRFFLPRVFLSAV